MLFLICLDPLLNNRLRGSNYVEHTNEEVCSLLDDYYGDRPFVSALYTYLPKAMESSDHNVLDVVSLRSCIASNNWYSGS